MKKFKVYVEKGISKKGSEYFKLYIDFIYNQLPISFDIGVIAQYCDLRPSDIVALKVGEKKYVADFELKG